MENTPRLSGTRISSGVRAGSRAKNISKLVTEAGPFTVTTTRFDGLLTRVFQPCLVLGSEHHVFWRGHAPLSQFTPREIEKRERIAPALRDRDIGFPGAQALAPGDAGMVIEFDALVHLS